MYVGLSELFVSSSQKLAWRTKEKKAEEEWLLETEKAEKDCGHAGTVSDVDQLIPVPLQKKCLGVFKLQVNVDLLSSAN